MINTTSSNTSSSHQEFYNKAKQLTAVLNKIIARLSGVDPEGVLHDIKDLYKYGGPIFKEYIIGGFKEGYNILNKSLKEAIETQSIRPLISGVRKSLSAIYKGFKGFFSRFPDLSNFLTTSIQIILVHTLVVFVPVLALVETPIILVSRLLLPQFIKNKLSNKDLVAEIKSAQELKKVTDDLHKIYPKMKDIEELALYAFLINKKHNIDPLEFIGLGLKNEQIHKLAELDTHTQKIKEFIDLAKSFKTSSREYILDLRNKQEAIQKSIPKSAEGIYLKSKLDYVFTNYITNLEKTNNISEQIKCYQDGLSQIKDELKSLRLESISLCPYSEDRNNLANSIANFINPTRPGTLSHQPDLLLQKIEQLEKHDLMKELNKKIEPNTEYPSKKLTSILTKPKRDDTIQVNIRGKETIFTRRDWAKFLRSNEGKKLRSSTQNRSRT